MTYKKEGEKCLCHTVGLICWNQTVSDCYCGEQQYRDSNGVCVDKSVCVPQNQCPGLDEEYKEVGQNCICTKKKMICVDMHKPACYCREGYFRDLNGNCVAKDTCQPVRCEEPQTYEEQGENCICTRKGLLCTNQTITNCYCPPDQYKDSKGACVLKSSCPKVTPQCKKPQIYLESGQECLCQDDNLICNDNQEAGCYCPSGYYEVGDDCVPVSECNKKTCKEPEIEKESGESCFCHEKAGLLCSNVTYSSCFCPSEDEYKDKNGNCVLKSTCQPSCKEGHQYQEEGEDCICYKNKKMICNYRSIPGCYCPPNHYENEDGQCVEKTTCVETCPPGEVYQEVEGNKCICDSINGLICAIKHKPGCYCDDGYV